uniref:Putative RNA dependent RNA polymerase n=1 Tax=Thrips tabaci associated mitovirus 1 TaxID=2767209 RepID=A0A7G9IR93_9VIRU|nr:putative RNA dependent RNA polymerase [Thrips tabaci associated mitovirus 1]
MGIYSSWAILALTHHSLVKFCGLISGIPDFSDYCILGDDIVIFNDQVAEKYKQVIIDLGVEISIPKSVIPGECIGLEFASRLYYENDEGKLLNISPLPLGPIFEGGTSSLFQLLDAVWTRSVILTGDELQFTCLLGKFPGKLSYLRAHSEQLTTLWSIKYLYQKWYKNLKDPNRGTWEAQDSRYYFGDFLRDPIQLMWEFNNVSLTQLQSISKFQLDTIQRQIVKAMSSTIKYSRDYKYILASILSHVNKGSSQVRHNLTTWPELTIFYNSPWYNINISLDRVYRNLGFSPNLIEKLIDIKQFGVNSPYVSDFEVSEYHSKLLDHNNFLSLLYFNRYKVEVLESLENQTNISIKNIKEKFILDIKSTLIFQDFLILSWGPTSIVKNSMIDSKNPLITRVSKYKQKIILQDILLLKSIKLSVPNLKDTGPNKSKLKKSSKKKKVSKVKKGNGDKKL